MIFHMGSSFFTLLNGVVTSKKGEVMIKQQLSEFAQAIIGFIAQFLLLVVVFLGCVAILVGNIFAILGFDGPINAVAKYGKQLFMMVYDEETAEGIIDSCRVVK